MKAISFVFYDKAESESELLIAFKFFPNKITNSDTYIGNKKADAKA